MFKNKSILKILSGLSFLIFICPFFQMCTDDYMGKEFKKKEATVEPEIITIIDTVVTKEGVKITQLTDTIYWETTIAQKNPDEQRIHREKVYADNKKEYIFNGYKLAIYNFVNTDKIEFDDLKDGNFYAFGCFSFMLLLSVFILVSSFKKKYNTIFILSFCNLLLCLLAMILFYFTKVLEEFNQIKFGHYLLMFNSIALMFISKKAQIHNA